MRITYLKLENVAGLYVGTGRKVIEIDFVGSQNTIVSIQGNNGAGKSVLISALTPFAYTTSLDERSTLNFILNGKSGYKEIHYDTNEGLVVIKHYYTPSKSGETHSVKSYFMLNGEELNENGNVTSFNALVEAHLGITQEMMRLIRLGTNVNSFVTLNPAKRKEYIGKLIDEIDMYLKIYKAVGEDIRVAKAMLAANITAIYNCHITDVEVEEAKLKQYEKDAKRDEKERDVLISKISKLESMMQENDIDDLRKKFQEASGALRELDKLHDEIHDAHLDGISVEKLIAKRTDLSNKRIDVQSKINSYRISVDQALKTIERLEVAVKKVVSNNDMSGLMNAISAVRNAINSTSSVVREFHPGDVTSDQVYQLIAKLQSFNQIAQTIYSFGKKPIEIYLRLKKEKRSVDTFLKEQQKKIVNQINTDDLRILLNTMFDTDVIITPNCDTEYEGCPYYRFAETITAIHDQLQEETLDGETLRYIQAISRNIDMMLNDLDIMRGIQIPAGLKEGLKEDHILDRMAIKLPFFDTTNLNEYLSLLREYEIYRQNCARLEQYEQQLTLYKQSGVDLQMEQIKEQRVTIEFYQKNVATLEGEIKNIVDQLATIDRQIALVSRYQEQLKTKKILESSMASTSKLLQPLESAADELKDLRWSWKQINLAIDMNRNRHRELDIKLREYRKLVQENKDLSAKISDLTIIRETVSTRKGIPVVYMRKYLGRIQKVANKLLSMIYEGSLYLDDFRVTPDTFEIPYIKNGSRIPDVKYSSQSENALMTMALSFALMNRATGQYNVLLLDEVDAGLDDENRAAFLKMLDAQMAELKAEQAFMISHNMSQMINIPMDCIQLTDVGVSSGLQNVIYHM